MTRECIIHCNVQYRTRYQYIYNIYCASDATGPSTQFSPGQIVSNHFNYYIRIICYIIQYRVCMCVCVYSVSLARHRAKSTLSYVPKYIYNICMRRCNSYLYLPTIAISRYRRRKKSFIMIYFCFFRRMKIICLLYKKKKNTQT